jgi:hypothetical protein
MPAVLALMFVLAACQSSGVGSAPASTQPRPSADKAQADVTAPPAYCQANNPCPIAAGTYRLDPASVLPGLEMTVPAGWAVTENTPGEFSMAAPGLPNDGLKFWLDMEAVISSGPGHGTTLLKGVSSTPIGLISWLTRDRDFLIVSKPAPATVGHAITMTSLVIGVSRSANYGDSGCPANPRCADLLTNWYWGTSGSYGIGGDGQVRLYLGTILISGKQHTFLIAFDADNHADLLRLEERAVPILNSVHLPSGAVSEASRT